MAPPRGIETIRTEYSHLHNEFVTIDAYQGDFSPNGVIVWDGGQITTGGIFTDPLNPGDPVNMKDDWLVEQRDPAQAFAAGFVFGFPESNKSRKNIPLAESQRGQLFGDGTIGSPVDGPEVIMDILMEMFGDFIRDLRIETGTPAVGESVILSSTVFNAFDAQGGAPTNSSLCMLADFTEPANPTEHKATCMLGFWGADLQ